MKKIALVVLISGVMIQAFSQKIQQPPARLTFREAVKIGLDNNVTLIQQRNQLAYTQVNKTSSLLQMGPSVQAQGSVYRNDGNSFNQQEGKVVNGIIDFVNGSISASVPLFSGLTQINSYRQANNINEAQLHQVVRSSQDVIRNVANQYLTCLLDYQLVKIDEENVTTQKLQYDQIKVQVELGAIPEADLFNQEYQLKNAELLLVRSRNRLMNDKAMLAQTLQIDPAISFDLEELEWDINTILNDNQEIDQMYMVALERRSDLKQAEFNEKAAHFGYSAIKGRYYPSIYAGAYLNSRYNYIHGVPTNRSFDDQFTKDNKQFGYGVSVSIPIYNGLQARTQAAFSKVNYENAKVLSKSTEVLVKTDVQLAYQNFNDAKTNYEASASQLRAAELTYKTEKERYDLGISNIVQLTTVNQAYIRAQSDFQNAVYTLMFQKLLMSYAMGSLSFEDIP